MNTNPLHQPPPTSDNTVQQDALNRAEEAPFEKVSIGEVSPDSTNSRYQPLKKNSLKLAKSCAELSCEAE